MKNLLIGIILATTSQLFSQPSLPGKAIAISNVDNKDAVNSKIRIKIGSSTFLATLEESATASAFIAILPITINMIELNGNEKYCDLSNHLPTQASALTTIQKGDLMMYGANTLVIFYKTFPTSYRYTKLGRVDNPEGLDIALGAGNVTLTFEVKEKMKD